MKLARHDNALETNLDDLQSQEFSIGDASVVIEILRNRLYTHPIRTLVQEYMSNGRDGQREVGSKHHMIVTIPSRFEPIFKVRDFGPGVSPSRMSDVFIKYGASTKRSTNNQTGGFGIGSKSGWSYTDSFTIITYIDGIKRTYVAHTGVNNQGRLDKISEDHTTEENGTEINIAVKPDDIWQFKNAIARASYFWSDAEYPMFKGTGANEIKRHKTGKRIGTHLELITEIPEWENSPYDKGSTLFVIDGIPYTPSSSLLNLTNMKSLLGIAKNGVIVHIGNSVVEVSASRESIADSDMTRNNLNKLALLLKNSLVEYIETQFKAVKSNADWIKAYKDLSNLVNCDDHSSYGPYKIYRSAVVSDEFAKIKIANIGKKWSRRTTGSNLDRNPVVSMLADKLNDVFYVDQEESFVIQNKRIKEYIEAGHHSIYLLDVRKPEVISTDKTTPVIIPAMAPQGISVKDSQAALDQIIKDFNARPLSSLTYTPTVRVPKAKRERTKEMFTIHHIYFDRKSPTTTTLEQLDKNEKYLFINLNQYNKMKEEMNDIHAFLRENKYNPCALSEDSIELVSESTQFISYLDWKKDFKPTTELLDSVKTSKANNYSIMKCLAMANKKVEDKHVYKMIKEYEHIREKTPDLPATVLKLINKEVLQFLQDDEKLTKLINDNYPLARKFGDEFYYSIKKEMANELVIYINAKI